MTKFLVTFPWSSACKQLAFPISPALVCALFLFPIPDSIEALNTFLPRGRSIVLYWFLPKAVGSRGCGGGTLGRNSANSGPWLVLRCGRERDQLERRGSTSLLSFHLEAFHLPILITHQQCWLSPWGLFCLWVEWPLPVRQLCLQKTLADYALAVASKETFHSGAD